MMQQLHLKKNRVKTKETLVFASPKLDRSEIGREIQTQCS